MIKNFTKLLLILFTLTVAIFSGKTIYAEGYDIECVSDGISRFTDGVVAGVGGKPQHIKFLSPVFNMTEPDFPALLKATMSKTSSWGDLDGVAGNAYNVSNEASGLISGFVNIMRADTGSKPIMLTEIGWYPHAELSTNNPANRSALKGELNKLKADSGIIGGLIFNVFGNNPDRGFAGQVMSDTQINEVCAGSCGKIGANSASGLQDSVIHSRAQRLGMRYLLSIIPNDVDQVANAANNAYDRGVTLVLRIGVGDDSGGFGGSVSPQEPVDPQITADFIRQLDGKLKGTVYIILGPNEPNAEGWADPEYPGSCQHTGPIPRDQYFRISGQVTTARVVTFPQNINKTDIPVAGVKITAFEGTSNTETCKDNGSLVNMSKKQDGTRNIVTTDADGYFEIYLKKNSGCGKTNYLVFLAGTDLKTSNNIVDMWRVTTTQDFEKDYGSLMISADIPVKLARSGETGCENSSSPNCFIAYTEASDPPEKFDYVDRLDFLTCASTNAAQNLTRTAFNVGRGVSATLNLLFKDHLWQGSDASDVPISDGESTLKYNKDGEEIAKNTASADMYGRMETTGLLFDIKRFVANATCTMVGCPEGAIKLAKNNESANAEIPNCNVYKQANQSIPIDSTWRSSKSYGPAIQLADPVFDSGVRMSENGLRYLNSFNDLKNTVVCKNNGQDIKFSQIQPPWYKDPEVSSRTGGNYLLGVEYFPWNKLFGGKRYEAVSDGITKSGSDSYESPDTRKLAFDPTLENENRVLSQPNSNSIPLAFQSKPLGIYTPGKNGQNASAEAASDSTRYKKVKIDGVDTIIEPPQLVVSDPKFENSGETDTSLTKEYNFKKGKGYGYVRLGKPQPLCVKSDLDNTGALPFNLIPFDDVLKTATGLTPDLHLYSAGYSFVTKANSNNEIGKFFEANVVNLVPKIFKDIFAKYPGGWTEGADHGQIEDELGRRVICSVGEQFDYIKKILAFFFRYTCAGDIKKDIKVDASIQTPTKELATGIQNYFVQFMSPFEGMLQTEMGVSADVHATNSTNKYKGFGADTKANSEEPSYAIDQLMYTTRDPVSGGPLKRAAPAPARKKAPIIPSEYGNCYLGRTDAFGGAMNVEVPDFMEQVLNRAGYVFDVPAAMLMSVLYSEGSFNRGYNWSNDAVINGSIEGESFDSSCDPSDTSRAQGPFSFFCGYWAGNQQLNGSCPDILTDPNAPGNAVKRDFPNRKPNLCNFMDQAYAAASMLHIASGGKNAYGSNYTGGLGRDCAIGNCNKCFGIDYTSTAGTCRENVTWNINNTISATRGYAGFCFDIVGTGTSGTVFECPRNRPTEAQCRETYQTCGNGQSCNSYVNNIVRVYDWFKH